MAVNMHGYQNHNQEVDLRRVREEREFEREYRSIVENNNSGTFKQINGLAEEGIMAPKKRTAPNRMF